MGGVGGGGFGGAGCEMGDYEVDMGRGRGVPYKTGMGRVGRVGNRKSMEKWGMKRKGRGGVSGFLREGCRFKG